MKPVTLRQLRDRHPDGCFDAQLTIRLRPSTLARLVDAAEAKHLTTSAFARQALAVGLIHLVAAKDAAEGEQDGT